MRKFKILIVNTRHFPGGGDFSYSYNLANLLRYKGHEVNFFAMHDRRNLEDSNADLFVSNIDFRELNKNKNLKAGIKVIFRSIYSVEARQKFLKLIDRTRPDIIHLQNIHAHITPSIVFEAKKLKIPVIWTLHDYKLLCPNSHFLIDRTNDICEDCCSKGYIAVLKHKCKKGSFLASLMVYLEAETHQLLRINNKIDKYICPSSFLESKLIENSFPKEKVIHLPMFLPAQKLYKQCNGDYFLYLGKIEALKGIYTLITAAKKVPHINIKIAGRIIDNIDITYQFPQNCDYVGEVHGNELIRLQQNSKALIMPSLWYENQPFTILEAFSYGKPVIGSKIGGIVELIGNEERGLFIKPGDADLLAAKMIEFENNPEIVQEMGCKARKYILKNHLSEQHYEKLINIYGELI